MVRYKLHTLLGLMIGAAASYYVYSVAYPYAISHVTASTSPSCLVLVGSTTQEIGGKTTIVGTIRNDCKRSYGHVQVEFLLDRPSSVSNANVLELPVTASTSNLTPGATAEVTTPPFMQGVSYRVGQITGY